MSITDIIKEMLKRRKENKIQKRVEVVKDIYNESETEKEAIQKATDKIIKEIETHPDMPVTDFLTMVQEELSSSSVIVETTKKIPDVKTEGTVVEIAQKVGLPSKGIQEIIQDTDMSMGNQRKMVATISDEQIQKEERQRLDKIERQRREAEKKKKENSLKAKLKTIYSTCDEIPGADLIKELKTIKEQNTFPSVSNAIIRVLARKAAIEWRQNGSTRIPSMTEIMTAEEMMEKDFPALVGNEFERIRRVKKYRGTHDYEYQEGDMQTLILGEIAKKVVVTYHKVGIIDIPQSERMNGLTSEQEEDFISQIQTFGEDIIDVEKIKKQIRGIQDDELEDLKRLVEKIPEDERKEYITKLKERMQEGKKKQLDPDVENLLHIIREQVEEVDPENAMKVLEDVIEDIKDRKKELEEEQSKLEGSTQSESDSERIHGS